MFTVLDLILFWGELHILNHGVYNSISSGKVMSSSKVYLHLSSHPTSDFVRGGGNMGDSVGIDDNTRDS